MRVNITGFSSAQASGKNTKNVLSLHNLIQKMLEESGYTAGRSIKNADVNLIFVINPRSINNKNMLNCLELMRNEDCILVFDDWDINSFYLNVDRIVDKNVFSKSHHHVSYEDIMRYKDVFVKIQKGYYRSIFPAFKNGDYSLLEIRGESHAVCPSIYVDREPTAKREELLPVHAGLATKWSDLQKKKYTILNIRGESEDKVFEYYCKHGLVLSPPHYHDGSGWWRNRYDLANRAHALIIEDDNSIFGDSYKIQRKEVNESNFEILFELQRQDYNKNIMTKDEISKVLKEVIK